LLGVSKSDFKKAIGSLYQEDLIEMTSTQIKLASSLSDPNVESNEELSQVLPPRVCATLYVSNIHPQTKNIQDLKTFVSDIFAKTPLILSKSSSLMVKNEQKKTSSPPLSVKEEVSAVTYLHLRKIRLKPQRKQILVNGQTVGHDSASDRYQQLDGRVGFIDVAWEQNPPHPTINDSQTLKLKKEVEQLCIQILNRQTFHGKRIKVASEKKETVK
jgi:hypothetical protein